MHLYLSYVAVQGCDNILVAFQTTLVSAFHMVLWIPSGGENLSNSPACQWKLTLFWKTKNWWFIMSFWSLSLGRYSRSLLLPKMLIFSKYKTAFFKVMNILWQCNTRSKTLNDPHQQWPFFPPLLCGANSTSGAQTTFASSHFSHFSLYRMMNLFSSLTRTSCMLLWST